MLCELGVLCGKKTFSVVRVFRGLNFVIYGLKAVLPNKPISDWVRFDRLTVKILTGCFEPLYFGHCDLFRILSLVLRT